jgi:acetyltransferase-like isoleucine patch superfamily enzyme
LISAFDFLSRVLARILIPFFSILPISKLDFLKTWTLQLHGCKIGKGCSFSPRIFILRGNNITIGNNSNIGVDCRLIDINLIKIGNNVLISHNVTVIAGDHHTDSKRSAKDGAIVIEDDVWIGASVTIVGPAVIGRGAVIGANSFVKGVVEPESVVGGSPARVLARSTSKS